LISKKLEVIIERIKTLDRVELEKLANVVEAEFIFRDEEYIKNKSTEDKENV